MNGSKAIDAHPGVALGGLESGHDPASRRRSECRRRPRASGWPRCDAGGDNCPAWGPPLRQAGSAPFDRASPGRSELPPRRGTGHDPPVVQRPSVAAPCRDTTSQRALAHRRERSGPLPPFSLVGRRQYLARSRRRGGGGRSVRCAAVRSKRTTLEMARSRNPKGVATLGMVIRRAELLGAQRQLGEGCGLVVASTGRRQGSPGSVPLWRSHLKNWVSGTRRWTWVATERGARLHRLAMRMEGLLVTKGRSP